MLKPLFTTSFLPVHRPRKLVCRIGVMVVALLFGTLVGSASAQIRITAAWDASDDGLTAGYRVSVGTSPGGGQVSVDVGQATRSVLPLPPGATYFITVRGYSSSGVFGPPSVEATVDLSAPPGPPQGFNADINGANASLGWVAPGAGGAPMTYLLSVGTQAGAANLVNGMNLGDVRRINSDLPPGQYFATLRAANFVGVGPASSEISFEVGGGYQPAAPTSLQASWTGPVARLSWAPPQTNDPARRPTSYEIEAGSRPGASDLGSVNIGNTTTFAVTVPPGAFYIRVRSVNARGASAPSNEILVNGGGGAVVAPGAPQGLTSSVSGGSANLRWNAASGAPTSYVVEVGTQPGASDVGTVDVGTLTTLAGLAPPGVYYVRIRAANAGGLSAASNEVVVGR